MNYILELSTKKDVPDFQYISSTLNKDSANYGIPFSKTRVLSINNWIGLSLAYLKRYINRKLGRLETDPIDFSSRTPNGNHIAYLLIRYFDHYKVKNVLSTKTGYSTSIEKLLEVKSFLDDEGFDTSVIDAVLYYKKNDYIESILNNQLSSVCYDKTDDPLIYLNPTMSLLSTGRLSTSNPNVQGFSSVLKKTITAPEGYKILSMDISGQETHILIWGILENKEIKEGYLKYFDPYKAFLHAANMPMTPALRKMVKVPVLSVMNGMSLRGILAKLSESYQSLSREEKIEVSAHGGYAEIAKTIYNLINNDPGYKKRVMNYVYTNKTSSNPMRKGLFGSTFPTNPSKHYDTQLKNGFFQVTAAEIFVLCLKNIIKERDSHGLGPNDFRLLVPIYDEVVFICKDEYMELAKDMVERNLKPIVDKWPAFGGKLFYGKRYKDGEENEFTTPYEIASLPMTDKDKEELDLYYKIIGIDKDTYEDTKPGIKEMMKGEYAWMWNGIDRED